MFIDKVCITCGKEFKVPHWRKDSAKYCSVDCQHSSLKAKPNMICPICGKPFHRKLSHIKRFNGIVGFCCSKKCSIEQRRMTMIGENNHQYGLKGNLNSSFKGDEIKRRNHNCIEVKVYLPSHPFADRAGRVLKHRLVVETNYHLFEPKFFCSVNGYVALKKDYEVHHIDGNHSNNEVSNLQVLTKSEHRSEHNKRRNPKRDKLTGRFIK